VLYGVELRRIGPAGIANDGVGPQAERAGGGDQAIAPIAEAVAIAVDED
jgi:hypothetical protein